MRPDLSQEFCSTTLGIPKDSEVIFADLASADGGGQRSYLAVLLTRGSDGSTNACRWRVNGATDGTSFTMTKPRWDLLQQVDGGTNGESGANGASLIACTLHRAAPNSKAQPSLSVVWESQVWQRFRIGTGSGPILEASHHVRGIAPNVPRRAGGGARGKSGGSALRAGMVSASLDSDYLLLVGRGGEDGAEDGASKDIGTPFNSITAWDCPYGTKQGAGHLRWSSDDASVAQYAADAATAACASPDGSLLAVALDKCVVVCGVQSAPMSLDMVVLAAARTRNEAAHERAAAMRPVDVLACITMAGESGHAERDGAAVSIVSAAAAQTRVAEAVKEGNRRESAILAQITSETKGSKWVEAVKLYLEDLQAEAVNTEAARRASRAQAGRRRGGGGGSGREGGGGSGQRGVRVSVSEAVVDGVMRRCTAKGADGKYDEAMLALVQAGAVTMRAQPSLLSYAIEVCFVISQPSPSPQPCLPWRAALGGMRACAYAG